MKPLIPSDAASRVLARDRAWADAARRRDVGGMMAIYALDAQELLPDTPPIVGRPAIEALYSRLIHDHPRFAHSMEMDEVTVAASGDLVVVRGRFTFAPDATATDAVYEGKFVGVWQWIDDDWYLKYNISNSISPPGGRS